MRRTSRDYLLDIVSSIQDIEQFIAGMDFEAFERDRKTVNAVIRSLEVMGEAVKKIPPNLRERFPSIPWKYMAGMRDKLVHEYHGVDLEIIWAVITQEIPPLRDLFLEMLNEISD
jgi:uncharacterized protein with HEPN domain